jgi:hypothetical protein
MTCPRELNIAEIDNFIVPGTVHLVDLKHTLHAKHAKGTYQDVVVTTPTTLSTGLRVAKR